MNNPNKYEAISIIRKLAATCGGFRYEEYKTIISYIETISNKAALYDSIIANTADNIVQATMEQHMAEMTQCFMGKEKA